MTPASAAAVPRASVIASLLLLILLATTPAGNQWGFYAQTGMTTEPKVATIYTPIFSAPEGVYSSTIELQFMRWLRATDEYLRGNPQTLCWLYDNEGKAVSSRLDHIVGARSRNLAVIYTPFVYTHDH